MLANVAACWCQTMQRKGLVHWLDHSADLTVLELFDGLDVDVDDCDARDVVKSRVTTTMCDLILLAAITVRDRLEVLGTYLC